MHEQEIIFTQQVSGEIDRQVQAMSPSRVFVLADSNTSHFVLPALQSESAAVRNAQVITIPSGDINKDLTSLQSVWESLTDAHASRYDVLINVGGGVVTDLGGFAAATYKRGIRFINVPTTLLGAVDAAVGGKTGINFGGFKNQVGAFSNACAVIISTTYFGTLTRDELLSGYAEMIKHAMLTGAEAFGETMTYDISETPGDSDELLSLLEKSVKVKRDIVAADPTEHGIRKALNLGHTVGHALESLAMRRQSPIPHGFAVAYGLVVESILSHIQLGFPSPTLHTLADYVNRHYSSMHFTCEDYPELLQLMSQDKKNRDADHINFTLLRDLGEPQTDCTASGKDIRDALDIYRDMAGI
ncbi:MAG: 3-dehydroquinate synthase [Muribaculaceae bacterium]